MDSGNLGVELNPYFVIAYVGGLFYILVLTHQAHKKMMESGFKLIVLIRAKCFGKNDEGF